jgi:branched-subunit amino acid ABC-type transport system permease component
MNFLLTQTVNGLVYGMTLFLIASGLSLIFGLMNVVNVAHGSFFMLGAFFGFAIQQATGSFWLALLLAPLPAIVLGVIMERVFMRKLYERGHLDQVLLTFGFTFVFLDLVKFLWGAEIQSITPPQALTGVVHLGGIILPKYRLFLIAFGFCLAVLLWLVIDRTRIGAMVRASVDDAPTAEGLGINVLLLSSSIFALGVGLAALGGVAAGPILGVYAGLDIDVLIPAFIVIVIGGMGSLSGAFFGSIVVGLADTFGKAYLPGASLFLIYLLMIVVLLTRPAGLLGLKRS